MLAYDNLEIRIIISCNVLLHSLPPLRAVEYAGKKALSWPLSKNIHEEHASAFDTFGVEETYKPKSIPQSIQPHTCPSQQGILTYNIVFDFDSVGICTN